MNSLKILCIVVCTLLSLLGVKGDASSQLAAVQEEFFEWNKREHPEFSTIVGDHRYNDRLTNLSISVFDEQQAAVTDFVNRTLAINRSQLSRQQRYSYDVLLDTLTTFTSNFRWRLYGALNPVSFMEAFYLFLDNLVDTTPFKTKVDYEQYIARLGAYPTQIEQMKARMRESIRLNTTLHSVSLQAVPGQITKVTSVAPNESVLYKPLNDTLDKLNLNQTEKDALRLKAQQAISGLWEALNGLKTFVTDVYMNHTRTTHGVWGLPSGKEYYSACLKWHLSIDKPPAEVHQVGQQEVTRIMQNMQKVMKRQGFNGTVAEYFNDLKADPRFHRNSAEELLREYENVTFNRIYPKLPQLFKNIPNNTVVIKPLSFDGPPAMYYPGAADGSRPGTFYVNLHRPNQTDTFSIPTVTLHEAVPGHHFQFISQAVTNLPNFQKHINIGSYTSVPYHIPFYTAYTEGWGLYSEFLGEELNVYENDYELMGRYGYEMVRACRVVVDTGMHYMEWTRQQAIDFMTARTQLPLAMVEIEIDRYITLPGQACAYKIGELKIKELRQRASSELGDKFEISDFHSLLLNNGPVPLSVMETIVEDYIDDKKKDMSTGASHDTGSATATFCDMKNLAIVKFACFLVYLLVSY